jgi:hypothetical protein
VVHFFFTQHVSVCTPAHNPFYILRLHLLGCMEDSSESYPNPFPSVQRLGASVPIEVLERNCLDSEDQ